MTPTPRTKKATHTCGECGPRVDADFAEKLERENAELRKHLEACLEVLEGGSYHNAPCIPAARSALGEGGSAPEPLPGQKNASTGRAGAREGR